MTPDIATTTLNRLKGIRYLVSVTIPTVYTNQLSYYEVCGKLIKYLDEIKANQDSNACDMSELANFVYHNLEEQEEFLNNFYTNFTNDITNFLNNSQIKWNNFLTQEKTKYNNYYTDITNRMNLWKTNFENNMSTFKTDLANKHTSYRNWLNNTHITHTNNLQTQVNSYKDYIDKANIPKEMRDMLDEIVTKYDNLIKSIEANKTAMETLISNKETDWNTLVDDLEREYENIIDRVLENNDILKMIIDYFKTFPDNLIDVGTPLYTRINYTGTETPANPQTNEIWLKTENMGSAPLEEPILRLYRYNGSNWILISDNGLYLTNDNHLYIADIIALSLIEEEKNTPTGESFNASAWWVPVGYDKKDPRNIVVMQQYSTSTIDEIELTYKGHSYTHCVANRGYGAYNLTYKNINNDFQRILTLKDDSVCLQSAKGIYKGTPDRFPNLYTNECGVDEDTPISTNADYTIVTGIFMTDYPIVYSTADEVYYVYYNGNFVSVGSGQPRFTIGTKVFCFKPNDTSVTPARNLSYYIDLNNPDTRESLTSPLHNELASEYETLQLSEDEKYIYSTNKVWLASEFLTSLDNPLIEFKPIIVLPTACEHAHIFNDVLYTTHTNYAIDLLNPLPDKFRPIDVNVKANGIYSEDTSTWKNGYIYASMFWQFSLINETDTTVSHRTTFGLQGFRIGAREISYVPISTPAS